MVDIILRISTWQLFIVLLSYRCQVLASTPFIIWSNNVDLPKTATDVPLGHSISFKDVREKYLNSFSQDSSKSTVLFLQDKLSLDDFTKFSSKISDGKQVFENLKKFIGVQSAVTIPSIAQENKDTLVNTLRKQHNGYFEEIYSSDLDVWKYKQDKVSNSKMNLFVFHLPPVKGSTEAGKASILSNNDKIVGKILSDFASAGVYTAILTAMQPSDIVEKMQQEDVLNNNNDYKRHLLSANVTSQNNFYNFSDCVYIYTTAIKLRLQNETLNFNGSSKVLSGTCTKNQSSISIVFDKNLPAKVTKFDLRMKFNRLPNNDWACSSLVLTYGSTSGDMTIQFINATNVLYAPKAMSYSCSKLVLTAQNETLTFERFQVQPFDIKNRRFSTAYDCATFFTIPILTGLFVVIVLLTVLLGGIIAMMSISTMDRFDDPKGPCIQVPHE
eukprot:gene6777-7540_t